MMQKGNEICTCPETSCDSLQPQNVLVMSEPFGSRQVVRGLLTVVTMLVMLDNVLQCLRLTSMHRPFFEVTEATDDQRFDSSRGSQSTTQRPMMSSCRLPPPPPSCPQVTMGSGQVVGPLFPAVQPAPGSLPALLITLLRAPPRLHRRPDKRQPREKELFWAARGKRPKPVHYWDVGVPAAGMTSATVRRFLGLPSKRQQEREARIDNGNGGSEGSGDDEDEAARPARTAEAGMDEEEEALPAVGEIRLSERGEQNFWVARGKKEDDHDFWVSRGKKGPDKRFWISRGKKDQDKKFWVSRGKKGLDKKFWVSRGKKNRDKSFWISRGKKGLDKKFWVSRGKKNRDKRFWISRGKRDGEKRFWISRGKRDRDKSFWPSPEEHGDLGIAHSAHLDSALPFLKASRDKFWGSPGLHGKWAE